MKKKNVALIAGLLASTAAAAPPLPQGVFLLSPQQGAELIRPCSRQSYVGDTFWVPSSYQVIAAEARLKSYLKTHPTQDPYFSPLPLSKYHRQYIGFTRLGQSYIYASFYPADDMPGSVNPDDVPVDVCDGGERYWGVLFSVASLQVLSVDISGALRSPAQSTALPSPPITVIRSRAPQSMRPPAPLTNLNPKPPTGP